MSFVQLSQQNQELLSAYLDGELDAASAAKLEADMKHDLKLRDAFDQLSLLRGRVFMALADESQVSTPARKSISSSPYMRWAAGIVLAAGLTLSAATVFDGRDSAHPTGALAWHSHFSEKEYSVDPVTTNNVVSANITNFSVPDLTGSKLYIVDHQVTEGASPEVVFHYRGLRGCRLTIWYSKDGKTPDATTGQFRAWKTLDGRTIVVTASGMDNNRFATIADYVKVLLLRQPVERQVTAMVDAKRISKNCAV